MRKSPKLFWKWIIFSEYTNDSNGMLSIPMGFDPFFPLKVTNISLRNTRSHWYGHPTSGTEANPIGMDLPNEIDAFPQLKFIPLGWTFQYDWHYPNGFDRSPLEKTTFPLGWPTFPLEWPNVSFERSFPVSDKYLVYSNGIASIPMGVGSFFPLYFTNIPLRNTRHPIGMDISPVERKFIPLGWTFLMRLTLSHSKSTPHWNGHSQWDWLFPSEIDAIPMGLTITHWDWQLSHWDGQILSFERSSFERIPVGKRLRIKK